MFSIFSSNFLTIRDKLFLFHLVNIIQFSIYFQVLINLNNLIYIFIAFLFLIFKLLCIDEEFFFIKLINQSIFYILINFLLNFDLMICI